MILDLSLADVYISPRGSHVELALTLLCSNVSTSEGNKYVCQDIGTLDALSCIVCTFKAFISQDVTTFDAPVDVAKLELLVLATTCLRVDSLIIMEGHIIRMN